MKQRTLGPRKHCLNSYYVNSGSAGKPSTDLPGTYGRTSSHHEMRWHWCLTAAYWDLITVWSQAFWCNLTLDTPQEVFRQFRSDQQNEKLYGVKLYRNKQHLSPAVQFSEWPLCNFWKHSLFPPNSLFLLVAEATLFNSTFRSVIASAIVKKLNLPMSLT